ncbi:uncharacterized protein SPSK_10546 [Sporothrix schenckii 1099-18]|uniref:Uncharacterized protein n=1 Tax=Sporothrix schenckii 1099-18 TaxID=1397361 RepID=A0A0F2LXX6_SPOSC|nr:uncharacterized protein SPSK_10546 [Sporothrix schenckii 1099-18]KJR82322.1 hypothetical protein SPSK_10546 [Sporothrix schenckii 1099-18]
MRCGEIEKSQRPQSETNTARDVREDARRSETTVLNRHVASKARDALAECGNGRQNSNAKGDMPKNAIETNEMKK